MPDDRITAELAAIRERERAATRGPWRLEPNTGAGRVWVQIGARPHEADCEPLFRVRTLRPTFRPEDQQREYRQRGADAAFIVAARSDIPRLLAAVEAALELASRWQQRSTTGYDTLAECADELRRVVAGELLSKEGHDD